MACGCKKPERTPLWTPIPEFMAPTEMLPGENMDCFMKRGATNGKNDTAEKYPNKVDNTALTSDLEGNVDTQFTVTPGSNREVAEWTMWTNGSEGSPPGTAFDPVTGELTGQVPEADRNRNYKVEAKAFDSDGNIIDSREYNFYPKTPQKGEDVQFVFPLQSNGARVTSGFGPRRPPAQGASSVHKGIDIATPPGQPAGNIVSAADGTVVKAGKARGFGNWVVVEHRDAQGKLAATTVYGHMDETYVTVGQKVAAGQVIAKEGNQGIGSGRHLHFELHKGAHGNPVDPTSYLNGDFMAAQNNLPGQNGEPDPNSYQQVSNRNVGMTSGEALAAENDCPNELPGQFGSPAQPNQASDSPSSQIFGGQASDQSESEPPEVARSANPSKAQTQDEIRRALDEDPDLTEEDKKHLMFVAKIESGFDASAKNPQSSARGTYQMLDKTADKYYGDIGYPNPTIQQRNDPYLATKAQIEFYKQEQKPYWNEFQNSGGTRIAGKPLSTDTQARYANLTQGEFTYGLIHHDGVGNAVKGRDRQGVDYYRKQIRNNA